MTASQIRTDPLRLLVLEHDLADAELNIDALEAAGFDVRADVAGNEEEFRRQISTKPYDVIIADYRLPSWTGMDALREIQRRGLDIPLILVTGTLGDERAVECVKAGAADYVLKENIGRLAIAVERALQDHRARTELARAMHQTHEFEVRDREREERFRKLVEAAFDAIVILQDGVVHECNRGFAEMFGLSSEAEAIGRSAFDFCAPESREIVERNILGGAEDAYEFVGLRRDGTRIKIEVTARSHTVNGLPGRISALRDVTEQRLLEEQFRQAQKMEAVGRLAGGVAHDFNNLLTVISSYAQLIHDDLGPHDPRRDDAQEILKASYAAASLTRQLLAFSRQEVIQPRIVVLQDLIKSSERMLRRLIGEDVVLSTVLSQEPLMINVDPGHFEQVIMNLAVNARDAMPTGGELTIETSLVVFDDEYADAHLPATAGAYAMFAMSDTGFGMDEQTRARIFEPFFTTKESGKGTGLGLATVYGIVKQCSGFIWVYTEPGHGATFKVYLPLASAAATPSRGMIRVQGTPRGTETVLIAEDAPAVRSSLRRILERLGYSVLEAPDGTAALDLAQQLGTQIDLLITDVVMPQMSGRDLAERFVALRPNAKVLYMSGYTDDAVLRHGVLSSRVEFLQKPFTTQTLAAKLRAVLESGEA